MIHHTYVAGRNHHDRRRTYFLRNFWCSPAVQLLSLSPYMNRTKALVSSALKISDKALCASAHILNILNYPCITEEVNTYIEKCKKVLPF